jgi:hypothetical protein
MACEGGVRGTFSRNRQSLSGRIKKLSPPEVCWSKNAFPKTDDVLHQAGERLQKLAS